MLRRVTLALAVVCVGSVCNCIQADLMSRLVIPRDYGVKLCGREFIRAVIFTCGGSRWRRSMDLDLPQWTSLSDVTAEDNQHSWHPAAELADRPSPLSSSYSLTDLLALYGRREQPPVASDERAERHERRKMKRNFSLGVAGKCCNQGCTKNDIGRLC